MSTFGEQKAEQNPVPAPPAADEPAGVVVRPISRQETFPVRREVLRLTEQMLDFEEERYESVVHLGAFVENELVGIVTLFKKNICDIKAEENPADHLPVPEGEVQWQFRGFATAFKMQKKGVGKELLAACIRHVKERGGRFIWCRARVTALGFYAKQDFSFTGDAFHVEGVGQHRYMFKYV